MRAGAEPDPGAGKARPGWLITGAIALAAATVYLCFSIAQALQSDVEPPGEPLAVSNRPADATASSANDVQAPVEQKQDEPKRAPKPTDSEVEEPRGELIAGLGPGVLDPALLAVIEDAVGDDGEHIAVAAKRVSDGRFAALNGDFEYYAASTFKLAVLYEAERRHFTGELDYLDTIVISEEDAAEDLGTFGALDFEEDGSITIGNLLEAMITVSDNSSAVALMHEFGSWNIDATLRSLGIESMSVNSTELWTTAADLARLMEAIYVGEGVSEVERAHMREILLNQRIRNGIPAAVGANGDGNLLVGNKTGTWEGAQHDVAFIEAQSGAYVLAVLTDGSWQGWLTLQRVATRIHTAMIEIP